GAALRKLDPAMAPITTGLGVLGMPGFTAYAGLNLIGKPKPGETVVVAAASGPVGSLVGQLAKLSGARAVGIAGGREKCRSVVEEFRFDAAVDDRIPDFAEKLAAACPNGIDVYFENVGGAVWQAVLPLLNNFARVPVCGLIAQYNATGPAPGPNLLPATMREVLSKSLTLRGYINYEFAAEHYAAFLRTVGTAIADGRIRYREDMRRPPSSACWKAAISAKRWCASRRQREFVERRDQAALRRTRASRRGLPRICVFELPKNRFLHTPSFVGMYHSGRVTLSVTRRPTEAAKRKTGAVVT